MHTDNSRFRSAKALVGRPFIVGVLSTLLIMLGLVLQSSSPSPARADTAPPDPAVPATVSSDALPTVQIDGVAWTQLVVGNTVYVGGNFTSARPAGAAAGSQESPRSGLLAYDLQTGALIASFAPVLNGQVRSLVASDTTLYVGGQFTTVGGVTRNRIAAFDLATGALVAGFQPSVNYNVIGLALAQNTLYLGGSFSSVNGNARAAVAAVDSATGALRPWAPQPSAGSDVNQLIVSPDRSKVILGGNFTTMNGSTNPGYGLAAVDTGLGANLPLPINSLIRDAGANSAIMSLVGTADGFYGSGYAFSKADGNFEGAFRSDWDGNLVWVEDCHGDTYSVFPSNGALYAAGHPHYCGNIGGFPQTEPTWTFQRAIAFSQTTKPGDVIGKDPYAYYNYEGKPRPKLLTWFPDMNAGTFTGKSQGPWNVSGNDDYVLYGGEFTLVNGKPQQGLVRFAKTSVAPNTDGPRISGANFKPTIQSFAQGIRISWPANYDRDNELLTYTLTRNGNNAAPISVTEKKSTFWNRPNLSYFDSTVVSGQTYSYRLRATDPKNNVTAGDSLSVTFTGSGPSLSAYDRAILKDSPQSYWPLGETSGTAVTDLTGKDNAVRGSSTTQGVPGAIAGDGTAYRFAGTVNTSTVGTTVARAGTNVFSTEAWFKTNTTKGGKIIGFGKAASGNSSGYDRQVYMSNAGRIYFGVYPTAFKTIYSPGSYNNNQWHHVVATFSPQSMNLYVDGQQVASRTDTLSAQVYNGYWRVGGDYLAGWPDNPSTGYFAGDVDQPAVYNEALSTSQVSAHYALGSGAPSNNPPTASFSATPTGLAVDVDGTGSSDTDGTIASYAWDFGDSSTASGATTSHTYTTAGTYPIKLTVTDNGGASGTTTKNVVVSQSNNAPTASFTATTTDLNAQFDASASTDGDGTITGYAWDFGDSSTGSGATTSHSYVADGTYNVKLTVTDDDGATGTLTKSVTVAAAPPVDAPFVSDTFNRSVATGLGSAEVGGAWTVTGGSTPYSVSGGAGLISVPVSTTRNVYLGSTLRNSSDTTMNLVVDKVATGGGFTFNVSGRRVSSKDDYRADVKQSSTGKVTLALSALQGSTTVVPLATAVPLPGSISLGDQIHVRMQTYGTGPTTIRAKAWLGSAAEPSTWTVSATDSYAGLQTSGAVGLSAYLSGTATNSPVTVSMLDIASKPVAP